ncbi:dihydrolipoyllysine-residue succinyltransferase [Buchnera aphidicola]|uniref:Dihydrolipoyllysine-residue succinyltransferase n=1 Tax=Buchnera aphidicola (Sarucallis kahawaluokalani) TaxID=1241878 RepID=A0A4D6YJE3_9GAMM|nr:dihydrolipoyllysine-residue succinyltransferase [Buchnera aphidicola]QCI26000.1 dihydrolipoyllysine-residue succinyltransferase [Buchnera aphidicola (Sarucallis kahawaluokalani)]
MKEIHILVPELPESVTQATVVKWYKKIGDIVEQDEILVDIETEKVILEVPSQVQGILTKILQQQGNIVNSKQILGYVKETKNIEKNNTHNITNVQDKTIQKICSDTIKNYVTQLSPSVRRSLAKNSNFNITTSNIKNQLKQNEKKYISKVESLREERVPISMIRKRISEKLLHTMHNTAMLTTFNEVNMQKIIKIRNKYRNIFEKKYNIRLGFMPFFIKSTVEALKIFPMINAKIENKEMVYYKYFDINIAISTTKGLVTPILKDVNYMSISDIEKKIQSFISKGNQGKLELSDLIGGNFTITNGGIFGSLLSTPIINPPQVAILGIHAIQERVIAIDNKIKIAPMMYIALSYDHCIIDGKEAVSFLKTIKNLLEDPTRILLDL